MHFPDMTGTSIYRYIYIYIYDLCATDEFLCHEGGAGLDHCRCIYTNAIISEALLGSSPDPSTLDPQTLNISECVMASPPHAVNLEVLGLRA